MSVPLFHVDAFSDAPFGGNPAAVCLLDRAEEADWMQSVAREMNLSETAFVMPSAERFDLRWFTPGMEVDLCGHATLAAAHVLWETATVESGVAIEFATRSGVLIADRADAAGDGDGGGDGDGEWIELDFPADPPTEKPLAAGLAAALGATPVWFGESANYHFAEVGSERELRTLAPDFRALAGLVPVGICVTSRPEAGPYDFVSRFFAPGAGIDEDPVTGSAHCQLAPYWSARLEKDEMLAYQASARGGVVRVRDLGERVVLGGQAVTVARGALAL